ncbi:polysaccharide biosynthesis family protein [Anoxybacillus sp. B7M1]|jgi:O-antigen/teichoic acid export membrane protein|uniref:putative polysaccharide biosynthesis protein n=1 Tax=unclassified Anoxybacillus TaxID=2639704 RepID=UPI0005CCE76D|nr:MULTISPECIES: polysaccharide biosynthesis protein [unclassified Anoxybacillus]ANB59079.1 polysaccharide biosynthesis family protein [Anoxybacillus sp. B2M1]ANB63599.1 polysaccharide biosynthesis family protein [Anoxybacillus sp. B7M1]
MSASKLLRGTFILTAGVMLSRILGLVYVIPFYPLVGERGGALYSYGYVPYQIFISLATAGVPLAVSKFVSKYNALGEYGTGYRLFRSGLLLMTITGIAACATLYTIAPWIAPFVIDKQVEGNSVADVVTVIRAVSFALMIVPVMSLIRGFFQGHESMGPTAASQVVEQLIRIIFLLASCYIVLRVLHGSLVTAISLATFAAFIGALGGLAILIWYWWKRKEHLAELLTQDRGQLHPSLKDMYKELIMYAAPFVFVGLATPLYQLIDQFTFNRAMASIGLAKISEEAYSIFNVWAQKLVIIPVTLATSFGLTLIPTITKAYISGDRKSFRKYLNQTFQVVMFLTVPAVVGMAILAEPMYAAFYNYDPLGEQVLRWYAPAAILFAMFSVTAAVLQGINQQRFTVISLTLGLLVKLSLNTFFITKFATIGAILATTFGYFLSVVFNLFIIQKYTKYRYNFVIRRTILVMILTAIMSIGAVVMLHLCQWLFHYNGGKVESVVIVIICAAVGAGIYFWLSERLGLISSLFGNRFAFLQRKKKAVS